MIEELKITDRIRHLTVSIHTTNEKTYNKMIRGGNYQKVMENDEYTLLAINIKTGRKNQIRVHMQSIKHPIVGDKKYGSLINPIRRMGLHAQTLAFSHPYTKKDMFFESPIPKTFFMVFKGND